MKTNKLLTILLIGILFLCGCSKSKKSVTSDQFLLTCETLNIGYEDVSESYGFAKEAYQLKEDDYNILFIEGKTINDMSGMFYDDLSNIYKTTIDENNNDVKNSIKSGKNWKSIETTINDKYYYLIYVDNTYLYVSASNKDVEAVMNLRKAINY